MARINPSDSGTNRAVSTDEERREPEDSIAEQDSTSESDPMTDMGSVNSPARGGDTGDPSSGANFTDSGDSGGDSDSPSTNSGGGSGLDYTNRVPTQEEMTTGPDPGNNSEQTEASGGNGTSKQRSGDLSDNTTGQESVTVDASTESEARAQVTQQSDLRPSQFTIEEAGNGFQVKYPDAESRAADQLDDQAPGVSITRDDIQRTDGGGFTLNDSARETVAEEQIAERLGVLRAGIEVEGGNVRFESESAQRAALRSQYGEDAEITGVGDSAFRVDSEPPAEPERGQALAAPSDTGETSVIVPFGEDGQQTVENVQDYSDVRRALNEQSREASAAQAAQTRERAGSDLSRGALGNPREILSEDVAARAGEDVSADDVDATRSAGELTGRVTGQPRNQVVSQLEEETGLTLDQGDVSFSEVNEDGQTLVRGELDTEAQRRYRQEQAPGQGTPLEGVFEAGAGLQFDYEQSTAGVEKTFNRHTPDIPSSDDLLGAATAGAPVAAAEPTPAGELVVGGIAVAGGVVLAGEALSRRTSATGGVTSTEVEIPDNADGQFQNELEISGNSQQFVNELGVPDRSEQMAGPFGVPEQGITIDPEENVAPWDTDPEEMPVQGDELFVSEMDVPTEDAGEVTLDTQQLVGQQRQRPTSREDSGGFQRDRQQPAVPEDLIPDRDVVIGEETPTGGGLPSIPSRDSPGLVIGGGSGVQFIGRRARPDRTMTNADDAFLGVDLTEPYDSPQIRESAEQSTVGGSQSGPLAGVGTSPQMGSSVNVGPRDAARTAPATDAGPSVAEDAATAPATLSDVGTAAGVDSPGLTTDAPGFGTEPVTANAFAEPTAGVGLGFGEGGQSGRRDRPDFTDTDSDNERDDGPVFFDTGRQFERELVDPLGGSGSSDSDSIFGGFL
jgi:hypothetical protein